MSDLDLAQAAVTRLTGAAHVDDLIIFVSPTGDEVTLPVIPVVGPNPRIMEVRADLIRTDCVYVMAVVDDLEAGEAKLVGWVFGSQIAKEPLTNNGRDRIGQHAWARRSLREMRELEKYMVGPA